MEVIRDVMLWLMFPIDATKKIIQEYNIKIKVYTDLITKSGTNLIFISKSI